MASTARLRPRHPTPASNPAASWRCTASSASPGRTRQQPPQPQHVLNRQVAEATLRQQQRLLQQLVEAQQALRRLQQLRQQAEAARQQAAWQQQAQQWAGQAASAPGRTATSSGGAPFTTAAHHQHGHQQRQQQQAHQQRSRQHHRHYDVPIDVDDYWGRPSGAAGSGPASGYGSSHGGPGRTSSNNARNTSSGGSRSEQAWWQEFAHESSGGFHYQSYRGGPAGTGYQQAQHQAPQQPPQQAASEQDVRGELAALLRQSGGDLLCFVSALGIQYERSGDRRASMRNARSAALLRLHPDKLQQSNARQQAFGAHATQMVNELWANSGRR